MRVTSAVVVLAAIFVALLAASSASAAATLAGEQLRNTGGGVASEFSCNASGARIVFTASGDAVDPSPYPGTWEESVVLTAGPLTEVLPGQFYGPVTSFDATFRIVSGDTVITGTKSLSGGGNIDFACEEQGPDCDEALSFSATGTSESLSYDATIASPTGASSDTGTADFQASGQGASCAGSVVMFPSMQEDFVRSTAAVTYDDVCTAARRYSTDAGVAASLCAQLAAAQAAALRGATAVEQRQLSAAASLVGAQRGKSLTSTQADELLALIARL